jgi:DegV family protein with EDD domain
MPVRIVTDSACDLTDDEVAAHGIEVVPLSIRFGSEEFQDRSELSVEQFYDKLASSEVLPETAAPSPGAFEAAFRRQHAAGADAIVCINLSSDLSATLQAAQNAAKSLEGELDVRVCDSKSITSGLGTQVLNAAAAAADGASADDIEALIADLSTRTHVFGALDTLDNLKKGGRVGGAKALVASVLSIKPIIEVRDGKVEEGGKQRTRARALAFLVDKVREQGPLENLAVMHAATSDVDAFVERLRPFFAGEIVVGDIGPVIGTHSGPGAIGVVFQLPA